MFAQRSLQAVWHPERYTLAPLSSLEFANTDDCFWLERKMNEPISESPSHSADPHPFSFSSTNMIRTEDRFKDPPTIPSIRSDGGFLSSQSEYNHLFAKFHKHTASDSTNTSGSNGSSPTTINSFVDDSSATETSPGSSPESPPPTNFSMATSRPKTADGGYGRFFELQKAPPPRKERNMKNLLVNTSRPLGKPGPTMLLPLQENKASVAPSPFVKPPTPRKRKPNHGLTIMTPANNQNAPHEIKLTIPPTPAFARPGLLRHFQSSPSLPLVSGLCLRDNYPEPASQPPALDTILSPTRLGESPAIEEIDEEQNFDIPLSREEKPEAYPNGPICVYEPYIDLYLEPTAEQARKYDVILNVANEVRNPFALYTEPAPVEPDLRLDGGGGIQYAPKREHLKVEDADMNVEACANGSPTTPKATPMSPAFPSNVQSTSAQNDPEYIHIPWDHNSDIVPDLLRLVKLIDDRIAQGKRVLIHCQCGVSRSASLVVAYGLFKNPSMSVQEAYDAVKKRSKWIGPNMNLIMQLQEFRTSLSRGGMLSGNRALSPLTPGSALSEWNGPFSQRKPAQEMPLSAAAAPTLNVTAADNVPITPGPSSAPSGISWPTVNKPLDSRPRAISAAKAPTTYVNPSGRVLPMLSVVDADRNTTKRQPTNARPPQLARSVSEVETSLSSPRSAHFAMTPLQPPPAVESADSFGLMSPTATEFSSSPFDRSALLASLGMGSMRADEETPRRSLSLRSRPRAQQHDPNLLDVNTQPTRRLRGKISSPSLREQQQLQSLQAKIEASLPHRFPPSTPINAVSDALMSPRATEFTNNPFALPTPVRLPEVSEPVEAPATDAAPQDNQTDPRSPVHKGASPIIRSIYDVL